MAKPSASRSGRSGSGVWTGYLFFFLLGSLLTIAGYLYMSREKPPRSEAFSRDMFLVDQIIRSQLSEIGISKEKGFFHQSSVNKEGGLTWEQSFYRIELPRSVSFPLFEQSMRKSFSVLGDAVFLQASRVSGSPQWEIKIHGRVTHQLTFILLPKPSDLQSGLSHKVAIVIDDLGGENHISKELLHWDLALTFSILPFGPYSKKLAIEAHRTGKEVILHLPMEPHRYPKVRPGEGTLLEKMDEAGLLRQLSKDIEAVPYIKGVSNHMGSRLMEDPEKMKIILSELKRRGLFFLDSRTTAQTVGLMTAQSLGMRAMERNFFLDHLQGEDDIKQKLEQLVQFSLSTGKAIGIGHPHPSTLRSLKEMLPKMKERGIDIVPLSSIME